MVEDKSGNFFDNEVRKARRGRVLSVLKGGATALGALAAMGAIGYGLAAESVVGVFESSCALVLFGLTTLAYRAEFKDMGLLAKELLACKANGVTQSEYRFMTEYKRGGWPEYMYTKVGR